MKLTVKKNSHCNFNKSLGAFDQATILWRNIEVSLLKQKWSQHFKGKVLDLGCGEGEIANAVFEKQIEWGLDNDSEMINKAKRNHIYKIVLEADATKIPLKNGKVDLVFANSVLEHIPNIDLVFKEAYRVLKPGGQLIATMPSHKLVDYLSLGKLYGWWFNQKYHHFHLYNLSKWKRILCQYDFQLVDGYYYLDQPTIKLWHRLLWLNKLGIKTKQETVNARFLNLGAGVAIRAQKILKNKIRQ
ncbi:MAG: methyltransferase domain-containing protein [Patescibacteria group bacterium]|nr:class I SAM-dependent methyltransferase [Patescibacteria group bacterium]